MKKKKRLNPKNYQWTRLDATGKTIYIKVSEMTADELQQALCQTLDTFDLLKNKIAACDEINY